MSEAAEIVALFKQADQMMTDYIRMVEVFRGHIGARLRSNVPLPHGVRVALKTSEDGAFLEMAYRDLEEDVEVLRTHQHQMRLKLSNDRMTYRFVADAKNLATGWSNNADRSMESVLDYDYMESDILSPPYMYWRMIKDNFRSYFPFLSDDPRWQQKMTAVADYLNTVENPWAKYAAK